MAEDEDKDDKAFDPSQRKLDRAREDGDVIRSEEMQSSAAQAGFLIALLAGGGWMIQRIGNAGMAFLDHPETLSKQGAPAIISALLQMAAPVLIPLAAAGVAVLIWLAGSQGLVFAPSRLAMKVSRLSVLSNARQKFGIAGLLDFAKKTSKMLVIGLVLWLYLNSQREVILTSLYQETGQISRQIGRLLTGFLMLGLLVTLIFGAVDYLLQRHHFLQRHRMSRKEMTDEMKDSEGDPHLKADRRRRAQEIATRQMLADVPKADVVIVNPTHYAVALKWDRARGRAPVCVAKGTDEVAARIRERAAEAGVPIRRDPPTARALHGALKVGQEIRREHYAAVAAAIRFADALRARRKVRVT